MSGRSFVFRGYGASIGVDLPSDLDLAGLMRFVAPELNAEEIDPRGPSDLLLTRWNGAFHLTLGERRYGPYRSMENVFRGVSNGIHFVLGKRSPMTFLHAGSIELDGSAVVFPGRSRWGKSTLVAALIDQGCGYLSDEYAVVSSEGAVFPFSKPIRLRRGDGADYATPVGVSAPGGLPCAAVILTQYEEGSVWNPEPLTAGSAALGILQTALQSRDAPDQVLEAVAAMVRKAVCYKGARGDGDPTVAALRGLGCVNDVRQGMKA